MIGVGLDFGTSNSTIAWFDGVRLRSVLIEAPSPILPTAIHLSKEYVGLTGSAAIDQYVRENAARLVHLVPEIIGHESAEIIDRSNDTEIGELETSRNVVFGPLVDRGLPGRLFLGLKRLLGNPAIDRLFVFGRAYRLVALLTPILLRMREGVERDLGQSVGHIHLGRPVEFEGSDEARNSLAMQRLTESCAHAGFTDIEFYPEPVAAGLSFLWKQSSLSLGSMPSGTMLTVDFGGGTLDLAVLRYSGVQFEVLSTAGADWGGDRIDQLIFRHVLFPMLGEGETWTRLVDGRVVQTLFPFVEYEAGLLNWAITHTLNQNRYKTKLAQAITAGGPAAVKFERLKDLINYNYSYTVFSAIKQAKVELSVAEGTTIDIPELNLRVPFVRAEFDRLLVNMLHELGALIDTALSRAGVAAAAVDQVVRTGGSSQIVAVRNMLETTFPGKVTEHDPFGSVANGLAIANYHEYRF